ncbi:MAG: hypothetical protein K2W96_16280 [Gemmataceae bacterium]|nr:hypothetical protein [Gemmataceae bacterium]
MAQRHTAYLKRSAKGVRPEQILKAIRDVEWDLVAQACGVSMARIEEAHGNMRIGREGRGFRRYDLSYRPGDARPVLIERWRTAAIASGVIQEAIENLDPKKPQHRKARAFLEECVDTVTASYGSGPGEAMAPILASQACLWLAQQFDGVILDPCGDWYVPKDDLDLKPL